MIVNEKLIVGNPERQVPIERLYPMIQSLGLEGYFNPAVIPGRNPGEIILLARHVENAAAHGLPDVGQLVRIDLSYNSLKATYEVVAKTVIWDPADTPGQSLEDVRAFASESGAIVLGATIVINKEVVDGQGKTKTEPTPYGAIAYLDHLDQIDQAARIFRVCEMLGPGKNLTPIDESGNFMYRPDSKDHYHKLILVHWNTEDNTISFEGELDFASWLKDSQWADWRMGSTAQLIAIDDSKFVFMIHGIHMDQVDKSINPYAEFYTYSIGLAFLEKLENGKFKIIKVDPQPIAVPGDFVKADGEPMGKQLHPELRNAIYLCGYTSRVENGKFYLDLFMSYGDTETFLVSYLLADIFDRFETI
jgi:hypothetical protein